MSAEKQTTSRISFKLAALGRSLSVSLEFTLPGWLLKSAALLIAHLIATEVLGLDGADAVLSALIEILRK